MLQDLTTLVDFDAEIVVVEVLKATRTFIEGAEKLIFAEYLGRPHLQLVQSLERQQAFVVDQALCLEISHRQ